METKRSYYTLSDEKNLTLFISYLNVIKKHGEYATELTVKKKIEEAARPLYIGYDRATHIIAKMLKDRGKTNKITIIECNEVLEELRSLEQFKTINSNLEKLENLERIISAFRQMLVRIGIDRTNEEVRALVKEFYTIS